MRHNDAAGIIAYLAFLLTVLAFASLAAASWQVSLALFAVDAGLCIGGGFLFGRGGRVTRHGAPVREEGAGAFSPIIRRAR